MMPDTVAAAVRDRLDEPSLVAELETFVTIESPSQDLTASLAMVDLLAAAWAPFGEIRRFPCEVGDHLWVEVPGRGEAEDSAPVLLLGHSDTVWPRGTLAGPVPWQVEDGIVRGPGVYDMKAGLVVMLEAVRALSALGLAHPPVRVLISADEEVGSGTSSGLVKQAADQVRAVLGFESPHPDGSLKVGRLGSARVRLSVTGREAHAALDPDAGVSAIDELVDQLLALRGRLDQIAAERPGEILVNVGALSGGGRTNVVPGAASALIGFRSATTAAEAAVMAEFRQLAPLRTGAGIEVEVLSARPAWQASQADEELLAEVVRLGGGDLSGRPAAGAADTNTTGALGVATLDGFGPRGGGAHAVSEHILIASALDRVVLLTQVLHGLR